MNLVEEKGAKPQKTVSPERVMTPSTCPPAAEQWEVGGGGANVCVRRSFEAAQCGNDHEVNFRNLIGRQNTSPGDFHHGRGRSLCAGSVLPDWPHRNE